MFIMLPRLCKSLIVLIALLHLIKLFAPVNLVLLTILTLLLFGVGLFLQKKTFRHMSLLFFVLGVILLAYSKEPLEVWMSSLISMTHIVAIVVVMQLFTIPIEVGGYSYTIEYWLKRLFTKESSLYLFAMVITNLFSSFLLFGTVPVMVALLQKALKNNIPNYQHFFATAIMRGYALVLFWAPGAILMLLVMQITHVTWSQLFVPGLILSILGLGTSYLLEHLTGGLNRTIKSEGAPLHSSLPTQRFALVQFSHIVLVVLALLILIATFERLAIVAGAGKIMLAGLIVAAIWIAYYRSHAKLLHVAKEYWNHGVMQATDFSVFFIAVGLFAGAIDHSGILMHLQPFLQASVDMLGIYAILLIPIVFIGCSLVGIHALALVVVLGKVLSTIAFPVPTLSLALILILSASISFIISPFAGMALMTSKFLGVGTFDVSVRWNALFCTLFLIEGMMFAYLWGL